MGPRLLESSHQRRWGAATVERCYPTDGMCPRDIVDSHSVARSVVTAVLGHLQRRDRSHAPVVEKQKAAVRAVSNTIKTSIAIPGFPAYDAFCANTRFRITMAAAGDSSRAYLASCDGGMVNIIDTSSETYVLNLPAPISSRTVQGNPQNPPENPVFLIAGP